MTDTSLRFAERKKRDDMSTEAAAVHAGQASVARAHRIAYGVVTAVVMIIVVRLWTAEGWLWTIVYSGAVCATFAAVVTLATRRLVVGSLAALLLVVLVSTAAHFKREAINIVLHAYDLIFYLPQGATLSFLWDSYRTYCVLALAALAASGALIWATHRVDPTRVSRRLSAVAVLAFAVTSYFAAHAAGERRHTQMEWEGLYLTSFFQSWPETIETLWRGQLMQAAPAIGAPLFATQTKCTPQEKPPHIILIHHESIVPPSLFPTLAYDKQVDPFFRSDDGGNYKLRVETYGGASTLTEFSVLTGLSTHAFGGMRQFVQFLMAGKIADTLPKTLQDCGYRAVQFYPMLKSFLFAERFFKGVGFDDIRDLKAQKATRVNERDAFYFKNLLDDIGQHKASADNRPVFSFVETMATHWPYWDIYEPHVKVPGGGPGTHPEMSEYLRRLAMAKLDYDYLVAELKQRFPDERFLIVRYGDHQPMSTRFLIGWGKTAEAEDIKLTADSVGYLTFFAINGVNFEPRRFDSPETLDVPYLGTVLMRAAGLPLPDSYKRRASLIAECAGRYDSCANRDSILAFQRRLIDSGLVMTR